ncbi:MAG: hypothetical protein OXB88_11280 [Bacteriovoracales bacterium]|nr:hypothetical protein [Bacteriovoracales bacterium]
MIPLFSGLIIFSALLYSPVHGKLLDRIVGVFDKEIITLSELKRIHFNLKARKGIAKDVYSKSIRTLPQILDKEIDIKTIRSHLKENNYSVSDDQVESMIKRVQRQFRVSRSQLKKELKREKISFEEYFELLRTSREYNIFLSVTIAPLINITEQQIKNRFFRDYIKNRAVSLKYSLTAYRISARHIKKGKLSDFEKALKTYRSNGIIPKRYSTVETTNVGDILEENLEPHIKKILKRTNEGALSKSVFDGDFYTTYYIDKKDLVESGPYQRAKLKIHETLFQEETKRILTVWLAREREKHYIKKIL